jgi:hypothetical protein
MPSGPSGFAVTASLKGNVESRQVFEYSWCSGARPLDWRLGINKIQILPGSHDGAIVWTGYQWVKNEEEAV